MHTAASALKQLCGQGFCLWTGAGITAHLTGSSETPLGSWAILATELERASGLPVRATEAINLTDRLEACLRTLGRDRYQRELRRLLVAPLFDWIQTASATGTIPESALQVARIGMCADSIVNFNVETMSSFLLAGSAPYVIKVFEPDIPEATATVGNSTRGGGGRGPLKRSIFHPHGALNSSGLCVIAASEYQSMESSLAFQLAVHAAFRENLAIVGMSLEDAHLRDQLTSFRKWIGRIFWFRSGPALSSEIASWARTTRVDVIQLSRWSEFWDAVDLEIRPMDPGELAFTWQCMLQLTVDHGRMSAHMLEAFSPGQVKLIEQLDRNRGLEPDRQGDPAECARVRNLLTRYQELEFAWEREGRGTR